MDEKRGGGAVWIAAVLMLALLLPVLYVASIGPFVMIYANQQSPGWIEIVYAPLIWLDRNSEIARACLRWYADLWRPKPNQHFNDART